MSGRPVRLFPHMEIDAATAQRLIQQAFPGAALAGLDRISEGGSTSNYAATLSDGKRLLLKLYPEGGGNGALEMAAYRYAAQLASVPEVYWFDDSLAAFHRPYAILAFIDGMGLGNYVTANRGLPEGMARQIGSRLALLHGREYGGMAALDAALNVSKELLPVFTLHEYYLNGKPGSLIDPVLRDDALRFLRERPELPGSLAAQHVLCHGDFSPGNMIVDNRDEVWFIDFEYALAAPPYYDIGKFFRRRPGVTDHFGDQVYGGFIDGYNGCASHPLGQGWFGLSQLMDMTSLLHLLNYDSALCWAGEIEDMIRHTLRVLRGMDNR